MQDDSNDTRFEWAHVLYRLFDSRGELLYIGITNDVRRRFIGHASVQPWWPEVTSCQTAFLPNRAALEEAERIAIKAERPRHNKRHLPGLGAKAASRPRRSRQPRRRYEDGLLVLSVEPQVFADRYGRILGPIERGRRRVICTADPLMGAWPGHEGCGSGRNERHICRIYDPAIAALRGR